MNYLETIQNLQDLANLAVVLATLIAAYAAFESRRAATASKIASEGQLLLHFITEYSHIEMSDSLQLLRDWAKNHESDFANRWLTAMRAKDTDPLGEQASKVYAAFRRVKFYFVKAVRLRKAKLIRKSVFKEIAYVHGIEIYYDVVTNLDQALNPRRDKSTEEFLKKEIGRYKSAEPKV